MTMAACEGICENSFCSCDQSNIPNPEHISYKEENMAAARNENIQSKNLNLGSKDRMVKATFDVEMLNGSLVGETSGQKRRKSNENVIIMINDQIIADIMMMMRKELTMLNGWEAGIKWRG